MSNHFDGRRFFNPTPPALALLPIGAYKPRGTATADRSSIGMKFASAPPKTEIVVVPADRLHLQDAAGPAEGHQADDVGVVRQLDGEQVEPRSEDGRVLGRPDVRGNAVHRVHLQLQQGARLDNRRPAVNRAPRDILFLLRFDPRRLRYTADRMSLASGAPPSPDCRSSRLHVRF